MQAGVAREILLRPIALMTQLLDVRGEPFLWTHRLSFGGLTHKANRQNDNLALSWQGLYRALRNHPCDVF